MTDDSTTGGHAGGTNPLAPGALLSPSVSAVAAFTLAVAALLGQNTVTIGVAAFWEEVLWQSSQAFYVGFGLATLVQAVAVYLLARRAVTAAGGWETTLGRAAVVVAAVAVLAGALVFLAGLAGG